MSGFPLRTTLFASLAVNLLLIGGGVGAYLAGVRLEKPMAQAPPAQPPGQRAFMAALPPEVRGDVREEMVRTWSDQRPARERARDTRQRTLDVLRTEPYDAAAMRQAFADARAADGSVLQAYQDSVADAFARMTPAQRRAVADALARPRGEQLRDGPLRERIRERIQERRRQREGAPPAP